MLENKLDKDNSYIRIFMFADTISLAFYRDDSKLSVMKDLERKSLQSRRGNCSRNGSK